MDYLHDDIISGKYYYGYSTLKYEQNGINFSLTNLYVMRVRYCSLVYPDFSLRIYLNRYVCKEVRMVHFIRIRIFIIVFSDLIIKLC